MGQNVLNWTTILLIALVRNLGAIITNLFGSLIYDNYQIIWNLTSVSWTVQAVLSYYYDASLRHHHIIISYMHYNKSLIALSSYSLAFFQHIFHRAISVIFLKYKPSRDNPLIKTIQWLSISLRVNEAFYYLALTSFSFSGTLSCLPCNQWKQLFWPFACGMLSYRLYICWVFSFETLFLLFLPLPTFLIS